MHKNVLEPLILDIGKVAIPYLLYDCNDNHGQTLILLHATGFPPQLWHPVAMELSRTYRVIVPYYSDHREAEPSTGAVNWMTLAEDLAQFCRVLNEAQPFVVGHSMGATIAAFSEAACGLNAAALVLIEPIFLIPDLYYIPFTVYDHPFASKSIKRIDYWQDEEDLTQYLKSRSLFQRWDSRILELYIQYGFQKDHDGGIRLICSPQREAVLFMGGMKHDPWPLFPRINCPALILEGADSENGPYVDIKKASSLIPHGTYALMNNAGHLIPMEKPHEISECIFDYLQKSDEKNR